ncbi:MAG: NAD(+) synthase [Flavobacteriales bacterium CG18_big_fil_WC_8_21_14_2_50_32_9]|nr:MAG: NAD(+) synthase [Flavobacteriales bacterium CG18_big_fil_WC_8_21_14_2_50_32_9]
MNSETVVNHIVNWLIDYARNSNTKGFVIGISGGIDSALTSTLGAKTGLPLICVEMPIYQNKNQVTRAKEHINFLKNNFPNVSSQEVELTPVFDAFLQAVPKVKNEQDRNMSLVNTRSRLRMTTLYYFAALHNCLVLGTGNKIEDFGVGFFTKYGDGGVDLSPIANLLKSEVYELAQFLGIKEAILLAPPTDGLWGDDRTDEDQIGASYPELEWAMNVVDNKIGEENNTQRQKEVLAIYRRLNTINRHKMLPIPVCEIPSNLKKLFKVQSTK